MLMPGIPWPTAFLILLLFTTEVLLALISALSSFMFASGFFFFLDTRIGFTNSHCNTDPLWDVYRHFIRLSHSLTKYLRTYQELGAVPRTGDVTKMSETSVGVGEATQFSIFIFLQTNLSHPARLSSGEGLCLNPWSALVGLQQVLWKWTFAEHHTIPSDYPRQYQLNYTVYKV